MEAAKVDDGMEFFFNFKPQYYAGRPPYYKGTYCSGLIIPDTILGGRVATII